MPAGNAPFFDKHFSPQLVLKRVVRLPSLDLAKTVDFALDAAKDTLPPLPDYFFTAQRREADAHLLQVQVKTENGVSSFYGQTTGNHYPHFASTLIIRPIVTSEWPYLICWTDDVVSAPGYAIMAWQASTSSYHDLVQSLECVERRS